MTGPANARTDPDTGLRFYQWEDVDYPSVTSIRRLIGMPFPLHQWALSKVIQRAIEEHPTMDAMLARERRPRERVRDKNVREEVSKWLRAASTEERDAAGERGTAVHDAIDTGTALSLLPENVMPYVDQWYRFLRETGFRVLHSERQVFNTTVGYAGQLDTILTRNGVNVLADTKTSSGIYIDHALQVMPYAMGEFIGQDDVIDQQATQDLRDCRDMGLVHLSPTSWEWVAIKPDPALWAAFTSMLGIARFLHEQENRVDGMVKYRVDSTGQGGFPW